MRTFWTFIFLVFLCALPRAAESHCVSAVNGSGGGAVFKTTGDPMLDKAIDEEASVLSGVFGVTPMLYTLDDSSGANAWADCSGNRLLIGLRLLREELWAMEDGRYAVAGILAHEFGHHYQCRKGGELGTRDSELEADYLAGWYLGRVRHASGIDVSAFASSLWAKGDYDFRNPSHHGTPDQRVASMRAGFYSSAGNASSAYASAIAFVDGHGAAEEAVQKTCTRHVKCVHPTACQHQTSCSHPTSCVHTASCQHAIACQHPIMTPYGLAPMHSADTMHAYDQPHAYDQAHPYDTLHAADQAHAYDTETYACQ